MVVLKYIICAAAAYFIGCLNAAYIYSSKIKNDDIRKYGSGNAGSTNVLRVYGIKAALPVFLFDTFKGFAVVFLTGLFTNKEVLAEVIAALFVVCGHNWPFFMSYRGGKGVAASLGACLALEPLCGAIALVTAILVIIAFRMVSLGALVGFVAACISVYLISGDIILFSGILILTALTFYQHRGNIKRIINGSESKIGEKKKEK